MKRKFVPLDGCGINITLPIFKTEMSSYQSKANFDAKILFVELTHHLGPNIQVMLVRGFYGNENSTFESGP